MDSPKEEKFIETGQYRGYTIHATNWNRFLVVIHNLSYPAPILAYAKKMIDDLWKTRQN